MFCENCHAPRTTSISQTPCYCCGLMGRDTDPEKTVTCKNCGAKRSISKCEYRCWQCGLREEKDSASIIVCSKCGSKRTTSKTQEGCWNCQSHEYEFNREIRKEIVEVPITNEAEARETRSNRFDEIDMEDIGWYAFAIIALVITAFITIWSLRVWEVGPLFYVSVLLVLLFCLSLSLWRLYLRGWRRIDWSELSAGVGVICTLVSVVLLIGSSITQSEKTNNRLQAEKAARIAEAIATDKANLLKAEEAEKAGDVAALIVLIQTSDHAIEPLGRLGKSSLSPLIALIQNSSGEALSRGVDAVSKIDDLDAILELIDLLSHENEDVRQAVRNSLINIGEPCIEPLVKCLSKNGTTEELQAAIVLAYLGDKRSYATLSGFARIGDCEERTALIQLCRQDLENRRNFIPRLDSACSKYFKRKGEFCPTVVLNAEGRIHYLAFRFPYWLQPVYLVKDIQLIAYIGEPEWKCIEQSRYQAQVPYSNIPDPDGRRLTMSRYRQEISVMLYEASSMKLLDRTTITGQDPPPFPKKWDRRVLELKGEKVEPHAILMWLKKYATVSP